MFHAHKLGLAGAVVSALSMLLLSLGNAVGLYVGATTQMQAWHMFYTPTVGGTITGMIEAAIITYIFLFVLAWLYNRMLAAKKK
ncbi:MAG: hypothetical protein ABIG32_02610 [Candidatus Uhrbacteria bacterium]|nr:hypothetical protein [Patescibacteria group bacterium]MBU1907026.1 hypothetical protein [Patescibacteria group bacterium]